MKHINYIPNTLTPEQQVRQDLIMSKATEKGGWKNKDLLSLGIKCPPTSGWRRRYILNGPDFTPVTLPEPEQKENIEQLGLL